MKTSDDIWDDIGSLAEEEMIHVVTKLFTLYEADLKRDPDNREALNFFQKLDSVITQTSQCNSNRR